MLSEIPLFQNLPPEQLDYLLKRTHAFNYTRNSVVITQGEQSNSLYIVLEGRLKVYVSDSDGRQALLAFLGKGDFFGELSLLDDEPRSASVMAMTKTRLLCLTQEGFMEFIQAHPDTLLPMLRIMAQRLRKLDETIRSLSTKDVYGRIAHVLMNEAEEQQGQIIAPRMTHQEIAEMVGSSREMVSRIMKELRTGSYISLNSRKQIIIERRLPARW